MKTLVVGDLHMKHRFVLPYIDKILQADAKIQRIVFLGDSCDDWNATESRELDALTFFAEWVEKNRSQGTQVDVLIGNHDFCYIRGRRLKGTVMTVRLNLRDILEQQLNVAMACTIGPYLCTHAGLTNRWVAKFLGNVEPEPEPIACHLNEMLAEISNWDALDTAGPRRGGRSVPGPLWADLRELILDPACAIPQIVGHTPVPTINNFSEVNIMFQRVKSEPIWACDTFSLNGNGIPIGDGSTLVINEDHKAEKLPFPSEEGYALIAKEYWNAHSQ